MILSLIADDIDTHFCYKFMFSKALQTDRPTKLQIVCTFVIFKRYFTDRLTDNITTYIHTYFNSIVAVLLENVLINFFPPISFGIDK